MRWRPVLTHGEVLKSFSSGSRPLVPPHYDKLQQSPKSAQNPPKVLHRSFYQRYRTPIDMPQQSELDSPSLPKQTAWSGPGPAAFDFR
ncbi:unnamed protein product, partial [Diplocarpon coronariae]